MSRLPTPGGDANIWGQVLNDFLLVSHQETGALAPQSVGSTQLQPGSVNDTHINTISQNKVSGLQTNLSSLAAKNVSLVSRAAGFIRSMMLPPSAATTRSSVRFDRQYDAAYTGAISGTFDLIGINPPSEQLCPINVATPVGAIADSYFGTITGSITGYASLPADSYTIQAYKATDSDYIQPSSAPVDGAGNFSLDLSTTPDSRQGAWRFALLNGSGIQIGQKWPQAMSYQDTNVVLSVITDAAYVVASQPAATSGTFTFPGSAAGTKQVQLINTSTNAILAEYAVPSHALRSYLVAPGEPGHGTNFVRYCYAYDQAIALLATISLGDFTTAQQLAHGLLQLQTSGGPRDGGFLFAGNQLAPASGNPYYRTGAHAIATYALLCYSEARPEDTTQDYGAAVIRALAYLDSVRSSSGATNGLYLGGFGAYSNPGHEPEHFNQGYNISWAATEHNLDTWHTLAKAAQFFGDNSYQIKADSLKQTMLASLWDTAHQRFYQGMQPSGPDGGDPLDLHSWGAIWLHANGRDDLAQQAMSEQNLAPFKLTQGSLQGYRPIYESGGYPGATPTIWSEGTFGVALAYLALGDTEKWQATIDGLANWQEADGAFRYANNYDATYEFTTSRSVAGTAWAILAALGHGIWGVTAPR